MLTLVISLKSNFLDIFRNNIYELIVKEEESELWLAGFYVTTFILDCDSSEVQRFVKRLGLENQKSLKLVTNYIGYELQGDIKVVPFEVSSVYIN